MPRVRTKYPSIIQKASARSSVSGASTAARSTTSRQNSWGMSRSSSACGMAKAAREGTSPASPGLGYQRRCTCTLARVIAASKRITGNIRATCKMVSMSASRTSARNKSSWAVSFQGVLVPSLPWYT